MRRLTAATLAIALALSFCAPTWGLQRGGGRARRKAAPTRQQRRAPVTPGRYYMNVDGERVPSHVHSRSVPAVASARCADGTYSFSRHRRGTRSHHGGVARWLR